MVKLKSCSSSSSSLVVVVFLKFFEVRLSHQQIVVRIPGVILVRLLLLVTLYQRVIRRLYLYITNHPFFEDVKCGELFVLSRDFSCFIISPEDRLRSLIIDPDSFCGIFNANTLDHN